MAIMSTVLGRLGARYSLTLDPHRREIQYGGLGLHCQETAELLIGIEGPTGEHLTVLPFCKEGSPFDCLEQEQTMTSVRFTGHSLSLGVEMQVILTAPFYPRDEKTSVAPVYYLDVSIAPFERVRWTGVSPEVTRCGQLRIGLSLPKVDPRGQDGTVELGYPVHAGHRGKSGEGGLDQEVGAFSRHVQRDGTARDRIVPLTRGIDIVDGELRAAFNADNGERVQYRVALVSYVGDALFERFGEPMRLKYCEWWENVEQVAAYAAEHQDEMIQKSRKFDGLFSNSDLPFAGQQTLALAFQSYLICSMWCIPVPSAKIGGPAPSQWFSVWEGSCWYNSTVDVTYNEAPFYFSFWPELLELIFEEWSWHANDYEAETVRCADAAKHLGRPTPTPGEPFPGAIIEHDMGEGWTANGQSYHHPMPVEENANFLLLLYAHGIWWDRTELFKQYTDLCKQLVEYLFWADSTGNGFPDRGTANTIDDATPAVQYGRDNVYLGVKRLAALHAAARMFAAVGEMEYAQNCGMAVERAVATLNAGWLGDHWGVCLDRSADGLEDAWHGAPLPFDELPGWDAYSLYTANGLLYLLMIDDLPPGIDPRQFGLDAVAAERACRTPYGSSHSSTDRDHIWISMNMWRDAIAAYLAIDMRENAERYWNLQLFANSAAAEKANGFSETNLTNNLVLYPRGTAGFAWLFGFAGLILNRRVGVVRARPVFRGRFPLFPLANWEEGTVPVAEMIHTPVGLRVQVHDLTPGLALSLG